MTDTYYENKRFLIVAPTRSGGTMLSHAIDSHPDIFCHRGEPIHKNDAIWRAVGSPFASVNLALSMPGYSWTGCKVTYNQFYRMGVESLRPLRISAVIHLVRKNPIRRIVSEEVRLQDKAIGLGTHTNAPRDMIQIALEPKHLAQEIQEYLMATYEVEKQIKSMRIAKTLDLSYETMTPYSNMERLPDSVVRQLCNFFEVSYVQKMPVGVRKRNAYPLKDIVSNYDEILDYFTTHHESYVEWLT